MTIKDLKPGQIVSYVNYENGLRSGIKFVTMLVDGIILISDKEPELFDSNCWAFRDFVVDKKDVKNIIGSIPQPSYL